MNCDHMHALQRHEWEQEIREEICVPGQILVCVAEGALYDCVPIEREAEATQCPGGGRYPMNFQLCFHSGTVVVVCTRFVLVSSLLLHLCPLCLLWVRGRCCEGRVGGTCDGDARASTAVLGCLGCQRSPMRGGRGRPLFDARLTKILWRYPGRLVVTQVLLTQWCCFEKVLFSLEYVATQALIATPSFCVAGGSRIITVSTHASSLWS